MDWDIIFWAVLAALAFAGELLSVSFFLLFFALGAVVALVVAFAGLGLVAQAASFVAASILSMAILRPTLLNRLSLRGGERYVSPHSIAGRRGVVTAAIEPGGSGTVRIGSGDYWTARSLHPGERIKTGTHVRVLDTDGVTALVEVVQTERGEES